MDRLVICSAIATLGKTNTEDDRVDKIKYFFMYSWTQDEYLAAIANQTFYDKVAAKLDATGATEVNDNDDDGEQNLSEDDKKTYAVNMKFYYAGGSCRFMFQCSTEQVKEELDWVFMFVRDKSELVTYMYCTAVFRSDIVDSLYGKQRDMWCGERFPLSSYVASLLVKQCDEAMIAELARRLNISKNPVLDGHVFEWMFLAAVQLREVKLFADPNNFDTLPQRTSFLLIRPLSLLVDM